MHHLYCRTNVASWYQIRPRRPVRAPCPDLPGRSACARTGRRSIHRRRGSVVPGGITGRDDDLPSLHAIRLPGQRDHRPALDVARLEPQTGITLLGRCNEVVQRHPIGMGEREQQLQSGPPLPGLQPRQRALRNPGRGRDTGQGQPPLGAESLEAWPDLLKGGGDPRCRNIVHEAHLTRISQKQQRLSVNRSHVATIES